MLPLVIRVKRKAGQTQLFAFADSPIRIGRSNRNHLLLEDQFVSRFEAVVRFDANSVSYFNVGGTNTVLLNGAPLDAGSEVSVDERSRLVIGDLELLFSREPVDDSQLIRRHSVTRVDEGTPEALEATMFQSPSMEPPAPAPPSASVPVPAPASHPAPRSQPPPRRGGLTAPSTPVPRQPVGVSAAIAVGESIPRPAAVPRAASPAASAVPESRPVPFGAPQGLAAEHAEYRRAWQGMLRSLEAELMSTPESGRAAVADRLQREYPQIVRENDFRELLGRLGLKPRKPGDPELEQWLRALGKGIFPPGVRLDTGMTIDRLGGLLKMFSQVFVEIQAAQNDARKDMSLPGGGRTGSLLSSEDPDIILAYLLNPAVDGVQRLAELEQCVTKLAVHEAALFVAVKDAAHALLEELAPDAVAKAEARSTGEDHGMLSRVFGSKQDAGDARLWRRYVEMHADLMDGKQFQRKFMGREFARIYMKAMEKLAPNE